MFIEKYDKIIGLVFILASASLNIVSYFYLPEKLVMQIKFNLEAGTTLPTCPGLISMFALLSLFVYKLIFKRNAHKIKWAVVSILILLINLFTVIFNL